MELIKILQGNDEELKKALFLFSKENTNEEVLLKFNLWSRYHFPHYFIDPHTQEIVPDAPFHKDIDINNLKSYRSDISSFVDIAYRGAGKTARTKLFFTYVIANDLDHFRKYIKVLSADQKNCTQMVTDIYNNLIAIKVMYPEVFEKSDKKREETMSSFTTSSGVKIIAGTVGTSQRGAIQDSSRPDLILFDDFEDRSTLRSAVKTKAIWDNMEEARNGLSVNGSCIYSCNYISEAGNVHKLIKKKFDGKVILIVPIEENGQTTWNRYTMADVERMKKEDDDFWGERMCKPSASKDVLFKREAVEEQIAIEPLDINGGLKIFSKLYHGHRIGSGHDVAGGVGLDSSTSVFIDFDVYPAQVIATYASNEIKPEAFGYEVKRQTDIFGGNIAAIENNKFDAAIAIARQQGVDLYFTEAKETTVNQTDPKNYGWNTNALTKPKMLLALSQAIEQGLLKLNDEDLINEVKGYTRNDLIENVKDPRLTTRHFDILIALAIAWQMKEYAIIYTDETPLITQHQNFD